MEKTLTTKTILHRPPLVTDRLLAEGRESSRAVVVIVDSGDMIAEEGRQSVAFHKLELQLGDAPKKEETTPMNRPWNGWIRTWWQ